MNGVILFYSHVNYSVTKILPVTFAVFASFYSHVNYSVTKIVSMIGLPTFEFYSHVNYSVTKIDAKELKLAYGFTVT